MFEGKDVVKNRFVSERQLINLIRGFAVFLMLWGHCIQYCSQDAFDFFEDRVFMFIYSFHMPLFMLISGYLFSFSVRKRNFKGTIIHRVQQLLQPIIMCAILGFLMCDVLMGFTAGKWRVIFGGRWLSHLTDYWFLWSTLSASIAVSFAYYSKSNAMKVAMAFMGIVFVYTMPCAEDNVFMYPYFVIGFTYGGFKDTSFVRKIEWMKYLTIMIFPLMLKCYTQNCYIYTSGLFGDSGLIRHMPVNLFRWGIGLVGSIFIIVLIEYCLKYILKTPIMGGVLCTWRKVYADLCAVMHFSVKIFANCISERCSNDWKKYIRLQYVDLLYFYICFGNSVFVWTVSDFETV